MDKRVAFQKAFPTLDAAFEQRWRAGKFTIAIAGFNFVLAVVQILFVGPNRSMTSLWLTSMVLWLVASIRWWRISRTTRKLTDALHRGMKRFDEGFPNQRMWPLQ